VVGKAKPSSELRQGCLGRHFVPTGPWPPFERIYRARTSQIYRLHGIRQISVVESLFFHIGDESAGYLYLTDLEQRKSEYEEKFCSLHDAASSRIMNLFSQCACFIVRLASYTCQLVMLMFLTLSYPEYVVWCLVFINNCSPLAHGLVRDAETVSLQCTLISVRKIA
jgi:hypothetical protein